MTKQSDVFLQGEGDAWHERNKNKPRLPDPVLDALNVLGPTWFPKAVLELGCGNGWRLKEVEKRYPHITAVGYDPSANAINEAVIKNIWRGTALEALSYLDSSIFDLIIFGFCLYLVDREDLMMIAAHTDRVLKDGGHIIIHDFYNDERPYKKAYKHRENVWSYHMRYPNLWRCNPAYTVIEHMPCKEEDVHVHVLKKDMANAYPERKV